MLNIIVWSLVGVVVVAAQFRRALRRREEQQERARIGGLIRPPRQLHTGFDPELRARTAARRVDANERRRRAASIDSGDPGLCELRKRA